MKRIAIILAAATGFAVASPAAYAFDGGWYAGYMFDHYRDYIPVATYDGYVPASYGEFTTSTYHDAPAYLGYRYHTVIHPANYHGPRRIRHRPDY